MRVRGCGSAERVDVVKVEGGVDVVLGFVGCGCEVGGCCVKVGKLGDS